MDKKDMAAGMTGIANRPKTMAKNVTIKKESNKENVAEGRKVISITTEDYMKIRKVAYERNIRLTAAVSLIVENSTIL